MVSNTNNDTAVVVGGGISGLLSALLLKERFQTVSVIERERECGGLMRSFVNEAGVSFDYGTHFAAETGLADLDRRLFAGIAGNPAWHALKIVKAGSYFHGRLNDRTQFIDATMLPRAFYQKGVVEMMNLGALPSNSANLGEYLDGFYGRTFARHILRPIVVKFFGCEPREIGPEMGQPLSAFGLRRIVALTPEATRELKKVPLFDEKLAFHSFYEGVSELHKYYPKQGGTGKFTHSLVEHLKKQGVNISTGESVQKIDHANGRVARVRLGSGQDLDCAVLVWTVPLPFFARAAGVKTAAGSGAPRFRVTSLCHFVFDKPFLTELMYLNCHDASLQTFRVTFYPNIGERPRRTPPYNCTVEVISDTVEDSNKLLKRAANELVRMGVVSRSARIIYQKSTTIEHGFPVMTRTMMRQAVREFEHMKSLFKNVVFAGRMGTSFFLADVLKDIYNAIRALRNRGHS